MSLTKKEQDHFSDQLPKGVCVVDLRDIKKKDDFINKYCPSEYNHPDIPYAAKATKAIEEFIKTHRNG